MAANSGRRTCCAAEAAFSKLPGRQPRIAPNSRPKTAAFTCECGPPHTAMHVRCSRMHSDGKRLTAMGRGPGAPCRHRRRCDLTTVPGGTLGAVIVAVLLLAHAESVVAAAPTFEVEVQADNSVTVLFSEAVKQSAGGSTNLVPADFDVSVTGGIAALNSFSVGPPTAGAGSTVAYTITLSLSPPPDGVERITVDVVAGKVRATQHAHQMDAREGVTGCEFCVAARLIVCRLLLP